MIVLLTYVFRVSASVSVSSLYLFRFVYVWLLLLRNAPTSGRLLVAWICICFVRRCVVLYYLLFSWCLFSSVEWSGVFLVFFVLGPVGYSFGSVAEH